MSEHQTTTSPELLALLKRAAAHEMTPDEMRAQRRSVVAAEMAMGSDADEAAYHLAWERGDEAEMARLQAEGEARRQRALATMERMGL